MLAPEKMSRLLIVASKDQLAPITGALYRSRLFHIEDFVVEGREGYDGFSIGKPLAGASEASGGLIKVRSLENVFAIRPDDIDPAGARKRHDDLARVVDRELAKIGTEVEGLTSRRSKLEASIKEYEQRIHEITPFADIPVDLSLYRGYERFAVIAGFVTKNVAIREPAESRIVKGKSSNFIVAVVPNENRADVESELAGAGFVASPIPAESGMPHALIDDYQAKITQAKAEIASIEMNLDAIRQKHADFLVACEEVLKSEVEQAEAPLRFATTDQTFVAEGWVPSSRIAGITDEIMKASGNRAYVAELPIGPHDVVPVEYNNPSFAKPSQFFMNIYARPKYTEIDPTLMLSIIFPIFFGLILGDIGYGLILLALCFALRKYFRGEDAEYFLKVIRNASISSIFFGVLNSEFLGFAMPWWPPYSFSRHLISEHGGHGPMIPELLLLAIWIGILHITLGRVLGMVNHYRQDHGEHRMKAVLANAGWLFVMWGVLVIIWSGIVMPLMPDLTGFPMLVAIPGLPMDIPGINVTMVLGGIMILAGVIFIARDSILEVVELPSIISHVLSYARLVAVGLSSVAIAMVVNFISIGMLIEPQLENFTLIGAVVILAGVVVFILGHALNTALGILGGGLHSIRLNYVEFFTKFYKGGGLKYNPFGLKRRFTED
ncbi:MAG TPA: V-type ATP synthase subunit I [Methanoregulaceae archaeon]|nr:V-type ATP synthase subunit I [Methanoregulaceae archaeon]